MENLINKWNEYCIENCSAEDQVLYNDEEAFEILGLNVRQVAEAVKDNSYNFDHKWVSLDGYANPRSSNDALDFIDLPLIEMEEWLNNIEF